MIRNPYKSQHTGRDGGKQYHISDERTFLAHIGTGVLCANRPGWDRLRYLRAYRAALEGRKNWRGCPGERACKDLADLAIRNELDRLQPGRGVTTESNHTGLVRHHVNSEGTV